MKERGDRYHRLDRGGKGGVCKCFCLFLIFSCFSSDSTFVFAGILIVSGCLVDRFSFRLIVLLVLVALALLVPFGL